MKKYANFIISIASLFTGGMLYVLFRENTYIGNAFSRFSFIVALRMSLAPFACNLLKYYLPDFLWGLALACGLQAILHLKKQKLLLCGVVVFLCGTFWECMQCLGVISGTGDFWDVFSYSLAGLLCIILNLKERE